MNTAYIICSRIMYESDQLHFACLSKGFANLVLSEMVAFRDALKTSLPTEPEDVDPSDSAFDDYLAQRDALIESAVGRWPYGVDLSLTLDDDLAIIELPLL